MRTHDAGVDETEDLRRQIATLTRLLKEKDEAEAVLRDSEATLRAFLESASQGVVVIDSSGAIALVNAKTEEMFGYVRDELLGQPLEVLLPEKLRLLHIGRRATYFAQPHVRPMGVGLDLAGRRKDGTEFPVEISLSYIDRRGRRLALGFITDITERKRFEEQLRQTQKLESLGVLAGGVAHDFNNLLTGIMGGVSYIAEKMGPAHSDWEILQSVIRASERAAGLVRQLLAYSGKGAFIVETVDLSALIRDIATLIQTSIPKAVTLRLELARYLPAVQADTTQMQQLVMNLIINAAEAIGDSAGTVTVKTGTADLDQSGARQPVAAGELHAGKYVVVEVWDTGCGMDEATRAKIFDPFFTTKFTGRGLGLAAALGIVRGHKGAIQVESAPGQGSTFRVLLPAADLEEKESAASENELSSHGTILLADDEEVVRKVARAALERAGFAVMLAETGQETVDLYSKMADRISLVVLDLSMPAMSGDEVLRRLQASARQVPVLVSSGYSQSEVVKRFSGIPIAGFLQKPYLAMQLVSAVEAILRANSDRDD